MAQELNTKMIAPLMNEQEIRPFDEVTVYATGVGGYYKEGEAFQVHPLMAAALIAEKKATEKAPIKAK